MTAHDKHYLLNGDNLTQPIQMQLSQKQKSFSQFFCAILKSMLNFKHFLKKMSLIAELLPEFPDPKIMLRSTSKKLCFTGPFDRQHGKMVEKLFQSEGQHLYHIY